MILISISNLIYLFQAWFLFCVDMDNGKCLPSSSEGAMKSWRCSTQCSPWRSVVPAHRRLLLLCGTTCLWNAPFHYHHLHHHWDHYGDEDDEVVLSNISRDPSKDSRTCGNHRQRILPKWLNDLIALTLYFRNEQYVCFPFNYLFVHSFIHSFTLST